MGDQSSTHISGFSLSTLTMQVIEEQPVSELWYVHKIPHCVLFIKVIYGTHMPYDPEGVLGSINSILMAFLGLQVCNVYLSGSVLPLSLFFVILILIIILPGGTKADVFLYFYYFSGRKNNFTLQRYPHKYNVKVSHMGSLFSKYV